MKQQKLGQLLLLAIPLGLTGCGSMLYSNQNAPVYSSPQAKKTGTSSGTTNSVAYQFAQPTVSPYTTAIEKPTNTALSSVQNNPYSRPVVVRPNAVQQVETAVNQTTQQQMQVVQNASANVTEQASQSVEQASGSAVQQIQTSVANTQAKIKTAAEQTNTAVTSSTQKTVRPPSATTALLQEARTAVSSGNYDKAASVLERAHRVEPDNAKILYDIAQIRYAQGKYRQAESFASKASKYSRSSGLSKKIWTLLSKSRKSLGNTIGAQTAAAKAANF